MQDPIHDYKSQDVTEGAKCGCMNKDVAAGKKNNFKVVSCTFVAILAFSD